MAEDEGESAQAMADAADDTALAMGAKAPLAKAGRKIAGARMALLKRALMDYAKALADAGDEDAATMLKALQAPAADPAATAKAIEAEFRKLLAPVAQTLLDVRQQVAAIAAQPAGGGPVLRFAGQPITKRLDAAPPAAGEPPAANPSREQQIAHLRRLAATTRDPALKKTYQDELAALAAGV
jgi:hypothetical protein